MKRLKALLISFSVLLLLIQTISVYAMPLVEEGKKGSLELHYRYGEQALGNMNAKIYKIAHVSPEGDYILREAYQALGSDGKITLETASHWYDMSKSLSRHIRENLTKAVRKVQVNDEGVLHIDNLTTGLYLVLTEKKTTDDMEIRIAPTLIALPGFDSEEQRWVYDRVAYPKSEGREPGDPEFEIEDEELPGGGTEFELDDDGIPGGGTDFEVDDDGIPAGDTDFEVGDDGPPGGPSKLPQTGMPMKPIIYMALAGVILFTAGWVDYQRKSN